MAGSVTTKRAYVAVADDAVSTRVDDALADLEFDIVRVTSLHDAVATVEQPDESCVVVFDTREDWLRDVARLCDNVPGALPLFVGALAGPDEFLAAVAAGVVGFCDGDVDVDALRRTVASVLGFGVAIPRPFVAPLVAELRGGRGHVIHTAAGGISVTDREWETLQMLLQRRSTREMADVLYVSAGTVRSHVSALLRKVGAVDRDDLIALVERGRAG